MQQAPQLSDWIACSDPASGGVCYYRQVHLHRQDNTSHNNPYRLTSLACITLLLYVSPSHDTGHRGVHLGGRLSGDG